ncbi:MAG: glycine dehydrogenase (aminomethyl-transferring), partial [Propionibacteriaceae bacterium]
MAQPAATSSASSASAPTVFADRHIGPRPDERDKMLATLGLGSLEDLVAQAMPAGIRMPGALNLPPALSETEALSALRGLAARNNPRRAMIGLGYHGTVTPSVIRRNVLEDPAWYTAYTPYQPEISQGRLEALLNFQTMVSDLTGLPTAGASLLDEATAVAEAMTVARRSTKTGRVLLLDASALPQTIAVVQTRAEPLGIEVRLADDLQAALRETDAFAVVVQTPAADGRLAPT